MEPDTTFYRRNLPHYQPHNASYFVTFRLVNSLPKEVVAKLKEQQQENEWLLLNIKDEAERKIKRIEQQKRYFGKFDDYLDKVNTEESWLRDERIAKIVTDVIHLGDGKKYELICYCIMPNHVHLVINVGRTSVRQNETTQTEVRATNPSYLNYGLTSLLREIKGSTARQANKIINRKGTFWQHESYDHVVRDEKELYRIIEYVLNNPVKAGLVSRREDWKWNYVKKF